MSLFGDMAQDRFRPFSKPNHGRSVLKAHQLGLRMSIKFKLIAALSVLALIISANSAFIWLTARDQNLRLSDGRARYVATAGQAANLVVLIKDMELLMVEVQQYLSDVSATRARDGLDTGFKNAQYNADQFALRAIGARSVAKELGRVDIVEAIDQAQALFKPYYFLGKEMAQAYIDGGTDAGNSRMIEFDAAADDLRIVMDTLKWLTGSKLSDTIDGAGQDVDIIAANSQRLVYLVAALALLSLGTIALVSFMVYSNILRPLYGMTKVLKSLATNEADVNIPVVNRGDEIGDTAQALQIFKESQSARRSSDAIQNILNRMPIGVFSGSPDGVIDFGNSYARTMFNVGRIEIHGMPIADFLPALAGAEDLEMAVLDELEKNSFITARRYGGSEFKSDVQIASVDDQGRLLWVIRDVTKKIQADEKRAELEGELRNAQKLESLGTMAGGIAHELNTPIQFITDNTNFLKTAFGDQAHAIADFRSLVSAADADNISSKYDVEYLETEAPQALDQSLEGLARVSEIVLAVKRFLHPSSAGFTANNLNDIVKTTVTVSRNQWKYIAELELDLDPNLPTVKSNAGELNQVLINLIVNAAHAIEDKKQPSEKGLIKVSTRTVEGGVECWVSDNGTGIKPEIANKIFDLFFTTKQPGRGTGQGLSVAHSIVTRTHQGKIWVESEIGKGTTFKVMLPLAPATASVV